MNERERYLETILFGKPDKVPFSPGGPRESTRAMWHKQGLPEGKNFFEALLEILEIHPEPGKSPRVGLPLSFQMMPKFEEKVLEHKDGHYIVQDYMGVITEISDQYDFTYIRRAKDFVTRKWHRFPVQTREDWDKMKPRFNAQDEERFPESFTNLCREIRHSPKAIVLSVNGPFWKIREWVGMENLCIMMVDDPDFVLEMAEFWRTFTTEVLERVLQQVRVDNLWFGEDMAYKAHSMISPAMARRFLQPCYTSWNELRKAHAVPIYDVDSDGYVEELIPVWIESGVNCCDPVEVAAGNDIIALRERFGRKMAYKDGIDKRAIAAGGETMRDEVMRVVPPLLESGGFIPGCDHGVPPDISWPNFIEYARLLAQLTGWL